MHGHIKIKHINEIKLQFKIESRDTVVHDAIKSTHTRKR